jgi:serine/threonine protein kinase
LVKYRETTHQRLNPRHSGKGRFNYIKVKSPLRGCEGFLSGVESGIRHLHSIGLVHNDLNPANIMLDDHENPFIIDFDSCCPIGPNLEGIGRTYQWYDKVTKTALPGNDLDALWDIREWLSDSAVKNFKFKE